MNKNMNIKIYKNTTKMSIMDVTSALDWWKSNSKNEEIYKGKICFSITEINNGKYEKAYIDKAKTKLIAHAILTNTFGEVFKGGTATSYGGTKKENGEIEARQFNIRNDPVKSRYVFQIMVGKGEETNEGGFKLVQADPKRGVANYASMEEAMKLALELQSFIQQKELVAMMNGKPLYTISNFEPKPQDSQNSVSTPDFKSMSNNDLVNFIKGISKDTSDQKQKKLRDLAMVEYDFRKKRA